MLHTEQDIALDQLCQQVIALTGRVAGFIRAELGRVADEAIEDKEHNSLVSYVDKSSETQLVSALSELLPGSAFLTEEETVAQAEARYRWIIDPLDGTTNFLHELPVFAISIALERDGEFVMGVVHDVMHDECFYAWEGSPAYCNGREVRVSRRPNLQSSLVATGFPYHDFSKVDGYMAVFNHIIRNSRGLRRMGAAAIDLAYVACGRFDAYFEYSLKPWDLAAGVFLVQQAGGRVTDFHGGRAYRDGREIIATNALVYDEMLTLLERAFE